MLKGKWNFCWKEKEKKMKTKVEIIVKVKEVEEKKPKKVSFPFISKIIIKHETDT